MFLPYEQNLFRFKDEFLFKRIKFKLEVYLLNVLNLINFPGAPRKNSHFVLKFLKVGLEAHRKTIVFFYTDEVK